jgi:cytochrome c1
LRDPQQVRPGSAMPDLHLQESEVADIVTYLFTLD